MVRVFAFTSLALVAVSAVSGLVIPRQSPPKGWQTKLLEPYGQYHERYLALDCEAKHGQAFFQQCCHPLLATESLDSLPSQCIPECDDDDDNTPSPTTSSSAAKETPKPTAPPAKVAEPEPTHPSSSSSSSTPAPAPSPTPSPSPPSPVSGNGGDVNTGGQATFFLQGGVAGACGKVHSDSDFICAMDKDRYGNAGNESPLCGKQVKITNTENGKTVTVTVADDCPTCKNSNSIDLSKGAFESIAPLSEGVVPISWVFV